MEFSDCYTNRCCAFVVLVTLILIVIPTLTYHLTIGSLTLLVLVLRWAGEGDGEGEGRGQDDCLKEEEMMADGNNVKLREEIRRVSQTD